MSATEPFLELSHNSDFVVSGMGKSTRVICFIRGQQFLGWYNSTGEQITGKDSRDRMYVENEEDSYSLVIQRLKLTDGGIYTCQGSKTKASHTLYVECKSKMEITRVKENKNLLVNKGSPDILFVTSFSCWRVDLSPSSLLILHL